jgi:putative photosynthetic complex assembly protein
MSSTHSDEIRIPRGALIMAGALVIGSIAATSIARIAQIPPSASPVLMRAAEKVAPIASRELRFTDRPDGAVLIEDTGSGKTAEVIEPGTNSGFIRGVMRGLARERRMQGITSAPPFNLTLWKDGELSLTDTVTGRSIELNSFGPSNRATFLALLTKSESPR